MYKLVFGFVAGVFVTAYSKTIYKYGKRRGWEKACDECEEIVRKHARELRKIYPDLFKESV